MYNTNKSYYQGQQYSTAHGFSRRAAKLAGDMEFAVCHGKKRKCRFFATFMSNSRFSLQAPFSFTFYKTIMALNGLYCADVPLSNYSLTHFTKQ